MDNIRQFDDFGRIVVPREVRREFFGRRNVGGISAVS